MTEATDRFALPGILKLQPYSPGMPIDELQRRLGLSNVVKLASNENPLGPSPQVKAVLADAIQGNLALYPDGSGYALKRALSAYHRIAPECITLGNGSNDVLDLIARTYLTICWSSSAASSSARAGRRCFRRTRSLCMRWPLKRRTPRR